jgi:hypothetical protein
MGRRQKADFSDMRAILVSTIVFFNTAHALADPVGAYDLTGTNPGSGSRYSGVVTVQRTGDTFLVTWTVSGARQVGIGLGAGDFLAVSYQSGNSIGVAVYRPNENGWKGIWAPAGSQAIGTETWTRRRSD